MALFPVTTVGSWPRPTWLLQALRKRQSGEISFDQFNTLANDAVVEAVRLQEQAGIDIVTDGEERRDNFYSFVVEKLEGVKLMTLSQLLDFINDRASFEEALRALDVPSFAMKSPVAVDKIRPKARLAVDELNFLKANTSKKIKVPIPGPYMLTRSSWFPGLSDLAYPTIEDLGRDVVKILHDEILALKEAEIGR